MSDSEKKSGRRWWRRAWRASLALLVLLVAALVALPFAAGALGPGWIAGRLERDFRVTASVEDVALRPGGSLALRGLAVDGPDALPLARLGALDAEVDLLGAVSGRFALSATVSGVELHLRRAPDGTWNVDDLERAPAERRRASTPRRAEPDGPLPDLSARVSVRDAKVVVHDGEEAAELALAELELTLDALDLPAAVTGRGYLSGAGTGGGSFDLDGSVTLAEGGRLAPRGTLEVALQEVLLAGLRPLFARFVPLEELDGRLAANLRLGLDSAAGPTGEVSVTAVDLVLRGPDGEPVHVQRLSCEGSASPAGAGPGAQRVTLAADDLFELEWNGTTLPPAEEGAGARVQGRLSLTSRLERLAAFARGWTPALAERAPSGALVAHADLALDLARDHARDHGGGGASAALDVAADELALLGADGAPLELADGLRLSVKAELGDDALVLSDLRLDGPFELAVSRARLVPGAGTAGMEVSFSARADLARVRPLLAALTAEPPELAGELELAGRLTGDDAGALALSTEGVPRDLVVAGTSLAASRFALDLSADPAATPLPFELGAVFEDLAVRLPPEEGGEPVSVATPRLRLDARGTHAATPTGSRLELADARIDSSVLTGTVTGSVELGDDGLVLDGLAGELRYVPDELGPLLAGLVPGALTGAEPRTLDFRLGGRAASSDSGLDLASFLAGADGRLDLGLGRYELLGFALDGRLAATLQGGALELDGDFEANGGEVVLEATLPGAAPGVEAGVEEGAGARLALRASAVRANSQVARLFAVVHPAFAQVGALEGADVDGLVEAELELSYDAPLSPASLLAGPNGVGGLGGLALDAVRGTGRLEVREIVVEGSPLLARLQQELGDGRKELHLRPMSFHIDAGRLFYDRPWTWTFDGTETTFTGSVGLDETLDLTWNVPVTDGLVERYRVLRHFRGETLKVPLRGTAGEPRLEWTGLLDDLARTALSRGLSDAIGIGGGSSDPAELLKEADALWSKGERAAAAKLYQRIRDDHKISLVYLLNKDRINDRRKHVE